MTSCAVQVYMYNLDFSPDFSFTTTRGAYHKKLKNTKFIWIRP